MNVGECGPGSIGRSSTGFPGGTTGSTILCSTSSIQNVAVIWIVFAFALFPAASPSRKAMLSVPPPNVGVVGGGFGVLAVVMVIVVVALMV